MGVMCSLHLCPGLSQGVEVHQTPSALLSKAGDTVQLVCSHGNTDYRVMLWYMLSPGHTALTLIGHIYYQNPSYEGSYEKHFNMTGDFSGGGAKNGSLFIYNLNPANNSAVYYCAISKAQCCRSSLFSTETLLYPPCQEFVCKSETPLHHLHLRSEFDLMPSYQQRLHHFLSSSNSKQFS